MSKIDRQFYIYKTTNLINGKVYIGQHMRNLPGYLGSGKILKYSIAKHGKENFKREILEYCDSKDELNEMEFHYIKQFNSKAPHGYNLTEGGEGCGDVLLAEPEKLKRRGEKISNATKGSNHYLNKMSAETRDRYIKENMSGDNHSARKFKTEEEYESYLKETRCGNNNALRKGKTEEDFQKFLDVTYRGNNHYLAKLSVEERTKLLHKRGEKILGRIHTAATKHKMSLSQRESLNSRKVKFLYKLPDTEEFLRYTCISEFCEFINTLGITEKPLLRKTVERALSGRRPWPRKFINKGFIIKESI